jgi:hypothetical protein
MVALPNSIDEALAQAKTATAAALKDGYQRLQVEILIPELKVQDPAHQFISIFEEYGSHLKVYFPDPGAAALARRDWGETPYIVRGMSEPKGKIQPEDEIFFFIEPSSVEVNDLEKMCEQAGSRPVVLFIPKLENIATIGIGYSARQLRERFISKFESPYYIRPLEGAALFRCYPNPWQVWLENESGYELISETPQKPVGEELEGILQKALSPGEDETDSTPATPQRKKPGLLTNLQRFFRALSQ